MNTCLEPECCILEPVSSCHCFTHCQARAGGSYLPLPAVLCGLPPQRKGLSPAQSLYVKRHTPCLTHGGHLPSAAECLPNCPHSTGSPEAPARMWVRGGETRYGVKQAVAACFAEAAGALLQGLGGPRGSVGVEAWHLKCKPPWECQKPRLYRPSMEAPPAPGPRWGLGLCIY